MWLIRPGYHDVLGEFGIGLKYLKISDNEYTYEQLLQIQNTVSTLFLKEIHYNLDVLGDKLIELFEKEDQIAVSLFLNWFKMLAVDGRAKRRLVDGGGWLWDWNQFSSCTRKWGFVCTLYVIAPAFFLADIQ
jgi:hypothetical protein